MNDGRTSVVSLPEYTAVLKRWARVIVGIVALGALVGAAMMTLQSGEFVAKAVVHIRPVVNQNDDPNLDTNRQISPETEVAIARSQRVAERAFALRAAAREIGTEDFGLATVLTEADAIIIDDDEVRSDMVLTSVSIVSESEILAFSAAADGPRVARDLAQSTAVAYLDLRRHDAEVGNVESRKRLAAREHELVIELGELALAMAAAGDDTGRVQALAYADVSKRQELTVIGSKFANLEALTVDPGLVLTDARLPLVRDGLPFLGGPIMGALLGLVAALTAAFVLDRSDDRLRSGRVELGALGIPMLGTAPVVRKQHAKGAGSAQLYPVNTAGSDAYRRLQGSLLFNLDSENKSVVLVTGVSDAASATSVATNVAATAARAGRRTLLIGADLRNDQLVSHVGVTATSGLSDVIVSGASLADSIVGVDSVDNLGVLGAGSRLERPADVLQSQAFARLMAAVQADFDLVIVEAPPVLRVADAVDIAGLCDGAIVVADAGSESRQAIADSVEQLRGVGSDIVGVVIADGS